MSFINQHIMGALDEASFQIPNILLTNSADTSATSPVDETNIVFQFIPQGASLPSRYSSRLLDEQALYDTYKTVGGQMANIKTIKESNQVTKAVVQKKMSKGAQEIVARNMKEKVEKECIAVLAKMTANKNEIYSETVQMGIPTESSLKGMLMQYTTPNSNYLMKLVMFQSVICRYKNTNDDSLIPLIIKLTTIMLKSKTQWNIAEEAIAEEVEVVESTKRKTHRQQQREVKKKEIKTDFVLPTINELMTLDLATNQRICNAIKIAIADAMTIIISKNIDIIKYQMTEVFDKLDDDWNSVILTLDEWQSEVISAIDNNETVVVTVPTGTGKTVCAQYCAASEHNKKVLFVVPSAPLAIQVAGSFKMAGYEVALVTEFEEYELDNANVKVFVCTPTKAETLIFERNLADQLNYAVFDEIHQINFDQALERMIKTLKCPFLILSATMSSPETFVEYLQMIKKVPVRWIKHNKRFIVQQRMIWNGNTLIPVNPLASVDLEYIRNEQFKTGDVAMTARDLHDLGIKLSELFVDSATIHKLHPNAYFNKEVPITNQMISEYEQHLKSFMVRMAFVENDKITALLANYEINASSIWTVEERQLINKIIELFKTLKAKHLLPALVFMMDDVQVLNMYTKLVEYLEEIETYYFPWYLGLMLRLHRAIVQFSSNEGKMKESIADGITGRGSKAKQIQDILNQKRRDFIDDFLNQIKTVYDIEYTKIHNANAKFTESEKNMIRDFLESDYQQKVMSYKTNQLNSIDVILPQYNPNCPTSLFTFHESPLSCGTMREIVSDLSSFVSKTMDHSVTGKMDYENIFVRGLERGIILHSNVLSTPFQRIVQKLVSRRLAPICLADGSLRFGVNLPTRTVVILGNDSCETVCTLDAQQMAGRSGRRGYDTQGNIIFCRINFTNVLRGTYAPLIGCDTLTPYTCLAAKIFNSGVTTYISDVAKIPLKYHMKARNNEWQVDTFYNEMAQLYADSSLYQQPTLMLFFVWLFRDDVAIAPNLFQLITQLFIIANNKQVKTHVAKKVIFELPPIILMQVIELLFRVLDRNDNEPDLDENIDIDHIFMSKDESFRNMLLDEEIWNYPIRLDNTHIIRLVALNDSLDDTIGPNEKTNVIMQLEQVVNRTLRIYNFFAGLGNVSIINILEHPLNVMVNKLNSLKSLN